MKPRNTLAPSYDPNVYDSALLKNRKSYFSLVWVMELGITSLSLGKVKVFPIILACQS